MNMLAQSTYFAQGSYVEKMDTINSISRHELFNKICNA